MTSLSSLRVRADPAVPRPREFRRHGEGRRGRSYARRGSNSDDPQHFSPYHLLRRVEGPDLRVEGDASRRVRRRGASGACASSSCGSARPAGSRASRSGLRDRVRGRRVRVGCARQQRALRPRARPSAARGRRGAAAPASGTLVRATSAAACWGGGLDGRRRVRRPLDRRLRHGRERRRHRGWWRRRRQLLFRRHGRRGLGSSFLETAARGRRAAAAARPTAWEAGDAGRFCPRPPLQPAGASRPTRRPRRAREGRVEAADARAGPLEALEVARRELRADRRLREHGQRSRRRRQPRRAPPPPRPPPAARGAAPSRPAAVLERPQRPM